MRDGAHVRQRRAAARPRRRLELAERPSRSTASAPAASRGRGRRRARGSATRAGLVEAAERERARGRCSACESSRRPISQRARGVRGGLAVERVERRLGVAVLEQRSGPAPRPGRRSRPVAPGVGQRRRAAARAPATSPRSSRMPASVRAGGQLRDRLPTDSSSASRAWSSARRRCPNRRSQRASIHAAAPADEREPERSVRSVSARVASLASSARLDACSASIAHSAAKRSTPRRANTCESANARRHDGSTSERGAPAIARAWARWHSTVGPVRVRVRLDRLLVLVRVVVAVGERLDELVLQLAAQPRRHLGERGPQPGRPPRAARCAGSARRRRSSSRRPRSPASPVAIASSSAGSGSAPVRTCARPSASRMPASFGLGPGEQPQRDVRRALGQRAPARARQDPRRPRVVRRLGREQVGGDDAVQRAVRVQQPRRLAVQARALRAEIGLDRSPAPSGARSASPGGVDQVRVGEHLELRAPPRPRRAGRAPRRARRLVASPSTAVARATAERRGREPCGCAP